MGFLDRRLAITVIVILIVLAGAFGAYLAWGSAGSGAGDGVAGWLWGVGMAALFLAGYWLLREALPGIDDDGPGEAPPLPEPDAPGADVFPSGLDPVTWRAGDEERITRVVDHRLGRHGHATVVPDPAPAVPFTSEAFAEAMDRLSATLAWRTEHVHRNAPDVRVFRRLERREAPSEGAP